ncbi:thiamine-phosphate kinase [Pasteurellaceae bacterium RH1A]|nr:thiamine-phosphate kinase [Pasteurellaceae bacterium RH1A]
MGEFDLIERYFKRSPHIGDDCAVLSLPPGQQLAISTDTLAVNTHFLPDIDPAHLAHKAVAVNLSDLAAMGANPKWVSLALTLPNLDEAWLAAFSQSLFAILDRYQVDLIGGDTTKGALSITLTAQGWLPEGLGLFRHQAQVGDWIYVSGFLGDSAAGLKLLLEGKKADNPAQQYLFARHLRPTPRVELGQILRAYCACAIDISDGLLADLSHILKRSQVGAALSVENLPISPQLQALFPQEAETLALTGGENYELCFTVSEENRQALEEALAGLDVACTCIGRVTTSGLVLQKNGKSYPLPDQKGFDHFGE